MDPYNRSRIPRFLNSNLIIRSKLQPSQDWQLNNSPEYTLLSKGKSKIPIPKSIPKSSDSVETLSQGSSSSDNSPRCDATLLSLIQYNYNYLLDTFPSAQSKRHKSVLNWLDGPPDLRGQHIGFEKHIFAIRSTSNLIQQVSNYFNRTRNDKFTRNLHTGRHVWEDGHPVDNRNLIGIQEYLGGIIDNELLKENRYIALYTERRLYEFKDYLRRNIISWIILAGADLKYDLQTVHIAVYLIDAFLHNKLIKTQGWPLLGLAAFQLAAKLEEKKRTKLQDILKKYNNIPRFRLAEVIWMEQIILAAVKFNINPSSAKLFVDLAVNSVEINFPSKQFKRDVTQLAQEILVKSLYDINLFNIRNSIKAEVALQVAIEYIMYYKDVYTRWSGTSDIVKNSVNVCYSLFLTIVQYDSSSRISRGV